MSFDPIHEMFIGDVKEAYKFFSAKNFGRNFYHDKNLPKREFLSFEKGGKSVDSQQIYTYVIEILEYVSNVLENTEKSIYLQFGRFRWPESADPADLTKSENFMFFDFFEVILCSFSAL